MQYDALVLGGSYAGLSAATYIARGRWSVCVVDAGAPRNRFSPAAHGFFGQDGARPADMTAQARAQLERYPSATFRNATALGARAEDGRFRVTLDTGEELSAARLVLAFGIVDILPEVPGLAERWGKTVLHCPYCHGYEFGGRRLGVLSAGPLSVHQARIIANWGPTTFFLNGQDEPGPADLDELRASGVRIERTPVAELEGEGTGLRALRLTDRRRVEIDALYVAPGARLASPIAGQLGCVLDDKPSGPLIRVDSSMMTTVPGVYAAGDAARWAGNAMLAAADGVIAGGAASGSMIFARHARDESGAGRAARPGPVCAG